MGDKHVTGVAATVPPRPATRLAEAQVAVLLSECYPRLSDRAYLEDGMARKQDHGMLEAMLADRDRLAERLRRLDAAIEMVREYLPTKGSSREHPEIQAPQRRPRRLRPVPQGPQAWREWFIDLGDLQKAVVAVLASSEGTISGGDVGDRLHLVEKAERASVYTTLRRLAGMGLILRTDPPVNEYGLFPNAKSALKDAPEVKGVVDSKNA